MHNAESPTRDDDRTEVAIKAAGADVAPRVTSAQIDALMACLTYYTESVGTSTFVHSFLDGRFYIATGHAGCVSPENYVASIGEKVARDNCVNETRQRLWWLEGYALYKKLQEEQEAIDKVGLSRQTLQPHQRRVVQEKVELDDRLRKLSEFIDSNHLFRELPMSEQSHLREQSVYMRMYSEALQARINDFG